MMHSSLGNKWTVATFRLAEFKYLLVPLCEGSVYLEIVNKK